MRHVAPETEYCTQFGFELFVPMSAATPTGIEGQIRHPFPKMEMFKNVSWGMHATAPGIVTKPDERVVFTVVVSSWKHDGKIDLPYIPSCNYEVEKA